MDLVGKVRKIALNERERFLSLERSGLFDILIVWVANY